MFIECVASLWICVVLFPCVVSFSIFSIFTCFSLLWYRMIPISNPQTEPKKLYIRKNNLFCLVFVTDRQKKRIPRENSFYPFLIHGNASREKRTPKNEIRDRKKNVNRHWNVFGYGHLGVFETTENRSTYYTFMHSHMPSVTLISEMLRNHEIYLLNWIDTKIVSAFTWTDSNHIKLYGTTIWWLVGGTAIPPARACEFPRDTWKPPPPIHHQQQQQFAVLRQWEGVGSWESSIEWADGNNMEYTLNEAVPWWSVNEYDMKNINQ